MFTRSRNFSMGFRLSENSKPDPSCAGVHLSMVAPCGRYMPQKRLLGMAAVLARGVCAGIIESSSGRASETPTPRKNVRRGKCCFVTILIVGPSIAWCFLHPHLKRRALDDPQDQIRESVVIRRCAAHYAANHWHVVILRFAPDSVHHQLVGHRSDESLGAVEQRLSQTGGPIERGSVH